MDVDVPLTGIEFVGQRFEGHLQLFAKSLSMPLSDREKIEKLPKLAQNSTCDEVNPNRITLV
jgi:hypothetical protein